MTAPSTPIDLVQAIAAIRAQLQEAAEQARNEDVQFQVESLEVEFQVDLRRDDKTKVGARAWVLSAGVEVGDSKSESHRVKVNLKPIRSTSEASILISDDQSDATNNYPFTRER